MTQFFRILVALGCSTLVACSGSESYKSATSTNANLSLPDSVIHRNIVFRGKLITGNEGSSLIPCGTREQYTLALSPQMEKTLAQQTQYPYQELYGELIGYLEAPSQTGFNADYQAQLVVKQINFVADDAIRSCSEEPHPTQALGIDPKWLVAITNQEIQFYPEQLNAPITQQQHNNQKIYYSSEHGSLTLTPELCQLQQDSHLYGWIASAKSDQGRYKGCARVSSFNDLGQWQGEYEAQSKTNTALEIKLILNNSHGAMTRYLDNNNQSEVVERGFWQILNPTQIEVVMTQNQGQFLISKRIFTRTNSGIKTEQEQIGQQLYPIQDGGMHLFKVEP